MTLLILLLIGWVVLSLPIGVIVGSVIKRRDRQQPRDVWTVSR